MTEQKKTFKDLKVPLFVECTKHKCNCYPKYICPECEKESPNVIQSLLEAGEEVIKDMKESPITKTGLSSTGSVSEVIGMNYIISDKTLNKLQSAISKARGEDE